MDPLMNLRDIQLPQAIGWWPLAIGWYLLGFFVLLVLLGVIRWGYRYWVMNKPRREVLAKLKLLQVQYQREADKVALAMALSTLLRRATLALYPRFEVASLQGEAWLHFLDETGNTQQFSQGVGRMMITAPYQSQAAFQVDELFTLITQWINTAMKAVRR